MFHSFTAGTLRLKCDDIAEVYIDGIRIEAEGLDVWSATSTITIPDGSRMLGVKGTNTGGAAGLSAEVTDSSGSVVMVSDEHWSCFGESYDGAWYSMGTYGINLEEKLDIEKKGISTLGNGAKTIWVTPYKDIIYCRVALTKGKQHRSCAFFSFSLHSLSLFSLLGRGE